jgi:hypothetical protein
MLSTGEIPAGHRLEWLRETIRREYADVEITPPADGNLFNEMRIFPWQNLRLSTIRSRFKRMLSLCSVRAIWYRSASGGMSAFGSVHCSERDSAMRISAPRAHFGRNPNGFHDLLLRGALAQGRLRVPADAIGALRHMRDRNGDELLVPASRSLATALPEGALARGLPSHRPPQGRGCSSRKASSN